MTGTFYIDKTWDADAKTYKLMSYQDYNYRYYYGIDDNNDNTGILLIVDDHNVSKAEVKSVYIYDYMNNKEIKNVKFQTVSQAELKADVKENNIPYEGLVKIEMPNAFKGLDYFRVDVETEFTKDNGATIVRTISYELERP